MEGEVVLTRYRLGVDIGGTFTDVILHDKVDGIYYTEKTLTTLGNLSKGVLKGVTKLVNDVDDVDYFVHGTTVGLNALLERKGSKMALILTSGFRDIYEIGRANRPEIYNIKYRKPSPLIRRRHIYEVEERIIVDGSIETPVNFKQLDFVIKKLIENDYDSVAISLLHSYRNPTHERQVGEYIKRKIPNISVSLSHEIAREWREYERTSTAVINGYIAPIVNSYLSELEVETLDKGLNRNLYIMQSNGGVMTSEVAKKGAIQTLMSGPVGGTMGSANIGELTDEKNLICIDMGGTSFDVSLVIDSEPDVTSETNLEGFPILSPMVKIHTIGTGGGSIAWLEGGGLRVGPKSAGSDPGPACYGNGGEHATITDANLLLGILDSDGLLDGDMKLNYQLAHKSVENIANQLKLSVMETAEGIRDVANAKMADAIRTLTVSKGIDPRDFSLVAFGGAGPMHAVSIAQYLGIKKVIIPHAAGIFSARGMLQTDIKHDSVRTFVSLLDEIDINDMNNLYKEMEKEIGDILSGQNIKKAEMQFNRTADLRYVGQEYTVSVPYPFDQASDQNVKQLQHMFHVEHLKTYGHNNPSGSIETVNLRVNGYGQLGIADNQNKFALKADEAPNTYSIKTVIWDGTQIETPVYLVNDLSYGNVLYGPLIIKESTSTIVIPKGYKLEIDRFQNMIIMQL